MISVAVEQLGRADQQHLFLHEAKAAAQVPGDKLQLPLPATAAFGEQLAQPLRFGLGFGHQIDAMIGRGGFQFLANSMHIAAELLDRFELQMGRRVVRTGRHARGRHRRETC